MGKELKELLDLFGGLKQTSIRISPKTRVCCSYKFLLWLQALAPLSRDELTQYTDGAIVFGTKRSHQAL